MIVAGLTGSIAMGKSTVAAIFASLGAPVFDSDRAAHDFYSSPDARSVDDLFPGVLAAGRIDRAKLAEYVLGDSAAMAKLEALVHPAVARRRATFLQQVLAQGRRLAIVDVPLLFETGGEAAVDLVIVVSASETEQRRRALHRPGMSEEKLDAILARQTPDREKRRRAHFVVDTNLALDRTRAQVAGLMRALAPLTGRGLVHA